jgi:hypothetical protein
MTRHPFLPLVLTLALFGGGAAVAHPALVGDGILLSQRLRPGTPARETTRTTDRFDVVYDPARLTGEQVDEAVRLAEAGWAQCLQRFGEAPEGRVRLLLTPDFTGATGFARGAGTRRGQQGQALVGVRFAELDYLGLDPDYVITHEIAHVFSGDLAGSALGEGIADWAAGGYNGIPLRPWWGTALMDGGLWIDPEALFIHGEFPANLGLDARIRTAQYVQSALLVDFLVRQFGWERTREFAVEYDRVRGRLNSNDARRFLELPPNFRLREGQADPRDLPRAESVREVFEKHFETPWAGVRGAWLAEIAADPMPPGPAERLIVGQQVYGAIRSYEMWLLAAEEPPAETQQSLVREAFTAANNRLRQGNAAAAREELQRAQTAVLRLRNAPAIATLPGGTGTRMPGGLRLMVAEPPPGQPLLRGKRPATAPPAR